MPEVRALQSFYDRQDRVARNAGDEWYCEEQRAERLATYGIVEILGLPKDEPMQEPAIEPEPAEGEPEPEEQQAPKRKRSAKKDE